ncbi:MAG TPA: cation transporter [Bacteroidia bacterium]|jgi:divalent metal cation (Fe/Co/Zn/Cd) transporter|nr:cation transporter [Bacteroidia bacterium]
MPYTQKLYKTAFALAIFTIVYNIIEGVIAVFFGYKDESLTLFGFGVDSFIEFISGLGIAHMIIRIRKNNESKRDEFEKTALKITGIGFYVLVAGLVITSVYNAVNRVNPSTTLWGVIISLISIVVMLILLAGKMKTGRALNSEAILADAECTRVCIYMSIVLLISSGIYELTHLPYVDTIGSLALAYFSFREGKECFEKAKSDKYCACNL